MAANITYFIDFFRTIMHVRTISEIRVANVFFVRPILCFQGNVEETCAGLIAQTRYTSLLYFSCAHLLQQIGCRPQTGLSLHCSTSDVMQPPDGVLRRLHTKAFDDI